MPRNAIIAMVAVVVSALSMGLAFMIRWPNSEDNSAASSPGAPGVSATGAAAKKEPSPLDPTLVTVDFDNLSGSDAIMTFADQSNLPVTSLNRAAGSQAFSIHLKNAPLMEGLMQLCKGSQFTINQYDDARISLYSSPGQQSIGKWSVSGPFSVVLQRIERPVDLSSGAAMPANTASLIGECFAEPKTRTAEFPSSLQFTECTDEKHQPITAGPDVSMMGAYRYNNGVPWETFQMQLALPASPGKLIAEMKGTATYTVVSRTEEVKTTDPAESVQQDVGDMGIEVQPLQPIQNGGGAPVPFYNLQVRFHRNQMEQGKWTKLRSALSRAEVIVYSANDERVATPTFNPVSFGGPIGGPAQDTLNLQVTFRPGQNSAEPHHLLIKVPVEVKEIEVPFEFKNLVLP